MSLLSCVSPGVLKCAIKHVCGTQGRGKAVVGSCIYLPMLLAGPRAQQLVLAELRQSRGSGQEEESQEHFGAVGQVEVVPNDE